MTVPNREQFANNASTTLNGGINNSVTSVTVTTGSVFPSAGNFRVKCGDEIMIVTARSSNTLTVIRGAEGTTATSHSSGDGIAHLLTAAGLSRFMLDSNGFWAPATRPPMAVYDSDGSTILNAANFTWVNQGSATATDENGNIVLDAPPASGENCRVLVCTAPSPTYTVIGCFRFFSVVESGSYQSFGLCARQSTSGKMYLNVLGANSGSNPLQHAIYKMTNATTFSGSNVLARQFTLVRSPYIWFKITDNNTNLLFSISIDGVNWIQTGSEARGSFMTLNSGVTGPDQVGFFINNYGTSNIHALLRLCSWSYSP